MAETMWQSVQDQSWSFSEMKGSRCPAKMFCALATAAHEVGPHSALVNKLQMKLKWQGYTAAIPLHHRVLTN